MDLINREQISQLLIRNANTQQQADILKNLGYQFQEIAYNSPQKYTDKQENIENYYEFREQNQQKQGSQNKNQSNKQNDFVMRYNRKENSLEVLCALFLQQFSEYQAEVSFSLDEAAQKLQVERRRIYDIVNVLESVEVVVRKGKNRCRMKYMWYGFSRVADALTRLYKDAVQNKHLFKDQIQQGIENNNINQNQKVTQNLGNHQNGKSYDNQKQEDRDNDQSVNQDINGNNSIDNHSDDNESQKDQYYLEPLKKYQERKSIERKEKSLGLLSQRFIQLFLVSDTNTLPLELAGRQLMCIESDGKLKNKIRRLYDIANILSSLHILEKGTIEGLRKPGYKWLVERVPKDKQARNQNNGVENLQNQDINKQDFTDQDLADEQFEWKFCDKFLEHVKNHQQQGQKNESKFITFSNRGRQQEANGRINHNRGPLYKPDHTNYGNVRQSQNNRKQQVDVLQRANSVQDRNGNQNAELGLKITFQPEITDQNQNGLHMLAQYPIFLQNLENSQNQRQPKTVNNNCHKADIEMQNIQQLSHLDSKENIENNMQNIKIENRASNQTQCNNHTAFVSNGSNTKQQNGSFLVSREVERSCIERKKSCNSKQKNGLEGFQALLQAAQNQENFTKQFQEGNLQGNVKKCSVQRNDTQNGFQNLQNEMQVSKDNMKRTHQNSSHEGEDKQFAKKPKQNIDQNQSNQNKNYQHDARQDQNLEKQQIQMPQGWKMDSNEKLIGSKNINSEHNTNTQYDLMNTLALQQQNQLLNPILQIAASQQNSDNVDYSVNQNVKNIQAPQNIDQLINLGMNQQQQIQNGGNVKDQLDKIIYDLGIQQLLSMVLQKNTLSPQTVTPQMVTPQNLIHDALITQNIQQQNQSQPSTSTKNNSIQQITAPIDANKDIAITQFDPKNQSQIDKQSQQINGKSPSQLKQGVNQKKQKTINISIPQNGSVSGGNQLYQLLQAADQKGGEFTITLNNNSLNLTRNVMNDATKTSNDISKNNGQAPANPSTKVELREQDLKSQNKFEGLQIDKIYEQLQAQRNREEQMFQNNATQQGNHNNVQPENYNKQNINQVTPTVEKNNLQKNEFAKSQTNWLPNFENYCKNLISKSTCQDENKNGQLLLGDKMVANGTFYPSLNQGMLTSQNQNQQQQSVSGVSSSEYQNLLLANQQNGTQVQILQALRSNSNSNQLNQEAIPQQLKQINTVSLNVDHKSSEKSSPEKVAVQGLLQQLNNQAQQNGNIQVVQQLPQQILIQPKMGIQGIPNIQVVSAQGKQPQINLGQQNNTATINLQDYQQNQMQFYNFLDQFLKQSAQKSNSLQNVYKTQNATES